MLTHRVFNQLSDDLNRISYNFYFNRVELVIENLAATIARNDGITFDSNEVLSSYQQAEHPTCISSATKYAEIGTIFLSLHGSGCMSLSDYLWEGCATISGLEYYLLDENTFEHLLGSWIFVY